MDEQQGREFSPSLPTTRASNVAVPTYAKFAKIRRRSCLRLKPLQLGTQPLQPKPLQAEPHRRSHRVARSLRSIRDSFTVLVETGSHWSDTTLKAHRTASNLRAKKGWRGRLIGRTKGGMNTKLGTIRSKLRGRRSRANLSTDWANLSI